MTLLSQSQVRTNGYFGAVELYAGPGENQIYQNPFESGFQFVNGYRFNRSFSLGVGIGVQTDYGTPIMIPIHLDARFHLLPAAITPFIQIGIGYGIALYKDDLDGINAQLALGLRIPISNRLQLIPSVAGRLQGGSEQVRYGPERVLSKFVEFRLGIAFWSKLKHMD